MPRYNYAGHEYCSLSCVGFSWFPSRLPRLTIRRAWVTVVPDPEPAYPSPGGASGKRVKAAFLADRRRNLRRHSRRIRVRGGGTTYHFNYDRDDQQNFADTANVCILKLQGTPGLPDSVTWNAYTPDGGLVRLTFDAPGFLALYTDGAIKHKNGTMQRGGERKAAVEAATTLEEVEVA
ncbi:MAG: hypothetical protein ACLSAH_04210 [Bilophila wadsworthia]